MVHAFKSILHKRNQNPLLSEAEMRRERTAYKPADLHRDSFSNLWQYLLFDQIQIRQYWENNAIRCLIKPFKFAVCRFLTESFMMQGHPCIILVFTKWPREHHVLIFKLIRIVKKNLTINWKFCLYNNRCKKSLWII